MMKAPKCLFLRLYLELTSLLPVMCQREMKIRVMESTVILTLLPGQNNSSLQQPSTQQERGT